MFMLKNNLKITHFVILMSFLNFLFFHFPFYTFVFNNVDCKSVNGIMIIISTIILMLVVNFLVFYLICYLSRLVGKFLLVLFFIINAIAVYFINTYSVIIDESMISNILNTKYEEAVSFFSIKLIVYIILLGVIPGIYIINVKIIKVTLKKFLITCSLTLLFILTLVFANASNWLWIDKNSKTLGGLAMPWSYTVNISFFYLHKHQENEKEILLPNATIKDSRKSVVVLVIGESARSQNFSLYGYKKNTNPLLAKTDNLFHFDATSCATYTSASVKCILEHTNTNKLN